MEKEAKKLVKEAKTQRKAIWDQVDDYVINKQLVRDGYTRSGFNLEFNYDDQVLMCEKRKEKDDKPDIRDLLRELLT